MNKTRTATTKKASSTESVTQSATVERYLEAIFYLDAEGEEVRAARLAEWMGVSPATTSATLQRMVRDELVEVSSAKEISLTTAGGKAAASIVRKHRIAERWLTDVLGLDWLTADEEAGRLEHALSDVVVDRLFKHIGEPATCPHGNPIPGTGATTDGQRRLSALEPGETSRIRRISEVAEHETPDLLRFLAEAGMRIGVEVVGEAKSRGGGTQTVLIDGEEVTMALGVADKVWID